MSQIAELNISQHNSQSENATETLLEPTDVSVAAYESNDAIEVIQGNEGEDVGKDEGDEVISINNDDESSFVSSPPESQ